MNMSQPNVLEKDKSSFVILWNGQWKLDINDKVVASTCRLPIAKQITGELGVGHWLAKVTVGGNRYKMLEDIPLKPPEGTLEMLLQQKKEIKEYADKRIEEEIRNAPKQENPDVTEVLNGVVNALGGIMDRLERLENGKTVKQDNREHDRGDDSGCSSKQTTTSKPKANRNTKGRSHRRSNKGGPEQR